MNVTEYGACSIGLRLRHHHFDRLPRAILLAEFAANADILIDNHHRIDGDLVAFTNEILRARLVVDAVNGAEFYAYAASRTSFFDDVRERHQFLLLFRLSRGWGSCLSHFYRQVRCSAQRDVSKL